MMRFLSGTVYQLTTGLSVISTVTATWKGMGTYQVSTHS